MKKLIIFLIFFIANICYSKTEFTHYKILVENFENYSFEKDADYIKYIISDALINNLSENFEIIKYEDLSKAIYSTKREDVLKRAKSEQYDFYINGYYILKNNDIKLVIKFYDLISNQLIDNYEMSSLNILEVYGYLLNQIRDFSEKLILNSNNYRISNTNIKKIRKNKKETLTELNNQNFIFMQTGILYSNLYFYNFNRDVSNDIDISSIKNNNLNYVSPVFNLEFYRANKNHLHGVGFIFETPVPFDIPKFFMSTRIALSYNLGLFSKYFIRFGFEFINLMYQKYSSKENYSLHITYMSIGFNLNFRYMPDKQNYYFEVGLSVLPTINFMRNNSNIDSFPFHLIVNKNTNDKNWFFPIVFSNSFGYFFNNNIGLYLSHSLFFMYVDYLSNTDRNNNTELFNFGQEFGIGNKIILGFVLKSFFN